MYLLLILCFYGGLKARTNPIIFITAKMKKYARNVIYDKLHKGGVLCCVALTLYGSVILGDHVYKYFKYVRPQMQAAKAAAEQELLSEGSSDKIM